MSFARASKPLIIAVAATAVAGALGGYVWREGKRPAVLEIYVFALSSGRSMLIRTPEDRRILIDGGANSDIIAELTKILPFYSRRIDSVVATNTEGKNASGLIDVLQRYLVDQVYVPAITIEGLGLASSTDQIYSTFLETARGKSIGAEELKTGRVVSIGHDVSMRVIFPADPDSFSYSKASAPEVLFTLAYGKTSLAFLGNASNKVQKYIASTTDPALARADVLVVSHSALPAYMSPALIGKLRPEYLIYSRTVNSAVSGRSTKPAPSPLPGLSNENRFNLKEKGTMRIVSDGTHIEIAPFR